MTAASRLVLVPIAELLRDDQPLLSLGIWCATHPRLAEAPVVASPYADTSAVIAAGRKVQALCEAMLPVLGERLNDLHGVRFDQRQWRVLLAPWLLLFVSSAHDRYLRLRQALQDHPGVDCALLDESACRPCGDTIEVAYALGTDHYNLQLMSRLLRHMGHDFAALNLAVPVRQGQATHAGLRLRLIASGSRLMVRLMGLGRSLVLLHSSYFPRKVELQLAKKSRGAILPWLAAPCVLPTSTLQPALRAKLRNLDYGSGEFETCLARMLPDEIPQSLLEDFQAYAKAAKRHYPESVAAVCSANSWYYDETFKHACVRFLAQGGQLLGIQHGGNYGSLELMLSEDHEMAICNRYYTWGWTKADLITNSKPMPAAKLIDSSVVYKASESEHQAKDVLWVSTSAPRYLTMYPFVPEDFAEYLKSQRRFITALAPEVVRRMRLRTHYEDNGWNLENSIKSICPDLTIEQWGIPFKESLAKCRFYICDHLSTTFLEALAVGKPSLLFWCPKRNPIRKEVETHYQALHQVGILQHCPESAAQILPTIMADIEGWWATPERQAVVRDFCQQFARTSPNAIATWVNQLKSTLEKKAR